MSLDFAADWLALREPADHRSRSEGVTAAALAGLRNRAAPLVVDLGCGRGSNRRYLEPRLPASTRWRLVDQDPALLHLATGPRVETIRADLRTADLGVICADADLVTAAALLDLVGQPWLERLLDATTAPILVSGNVDGRIAWHPPHPLDAAMTAAFLAHHDGDKGFGAALGRTAPAAMAAAAEARGRRVVQAQADWTLGPADGALQRAYLEGARGAIAETGVDPTDIAAWHRARLGFLDRSESHVRVGHVDLAVL